MPVLHSSSSGTNESSPRAMVMNPAFERYIGIDYSGAQTPSSSLKGLRVYAADRTRAPERRNRSMLIAGRRCLCYRFPLTQRPAMI